MSASADFPHRIAARFVRGDLLIRHLGRHTKASETLGQTGPLPPSRHASRKETSEPGQPSSSLAAAPPPESYPDGSSEEIISSSSGGGQSPFDLDASMATLVAELADNHQPGPFYPMDLDQDSNNQIFGSTPNLASTSASAADAALLANWHSAEPSEPLEPLQGYEPLEAPQPTDFFSNLYDLTYDINPNANQAADSYSWLFNFSPSAGIPDVGGYQVSPAAPAPSTPKVSLQYFSINMRRAKLFP